MGSKVRHWKERFRDDAEFVYVRSLNLGGGVFAKAGDPVDREKFDLARLRFWWDSGVIRLRDFEAPNVLTGQVMAESKPAVVEAEVNDDDEYGDGISGTVAIPNEIKRKIKKGGKQ